MTKMADGEEADAEVMLTADQITQVLAEFTAKEAGLELPVFREAHWMWSPGKGPVVTLLIRALPNVVALPVKRS